MVTRGALISSGCMSFVRVRLVPPPDQTEGQRPGRPQPAGPQPRGKVLLADDLNGDKRTHGVIVKCFKPADNLKTQEEIHQRSCTPTEEAVVALRILPAPDDHSSGHGTHHCYVPCISVGRESPTPVATDRAAHQVDHAGSQGPHRDGIEVGPPANRHSDQQAIGCDNGS